MNHPQTPEDLRANKKRRLREASTNEFDGVPSNCEEALDGVLNSVLAPYQEEPPLPGDKSLAFLHNYEDEMQTRKIAAAAARDEEKEQPAEEAEEEVDDDDEAAEEARLQQEASEAAQLGFLLIL